MSIKNRDEIFLPTIIKWDQKNIEIFLCFCQKNDFNWNIDLKSKTIIKQISKKVEGGGVMPSNNLHIPDYILDAIAEAFAKAIVSSL